MAKVTTTYLQTLSGKKVHADQPLNEKEGLYPFQALIQPISLRFKYHFESSRQTNKLDKVLFCMEQQYQPLDLITTFPA